MKSSAGMTYSVWDPMRRVYTYYATPRPDTTNPDPRHLPGRSDKVGVPSTAAGWPLPRDAVRLGEGDLPRGMIALSGDESVPGWIAPLGLGLIAYGLWGLYFKR